MGGREGRGLLVAAHVVKKKTVADKGQNQQLSQIRFAFNGFQSESWLSALQPHDLANGLEIVMPRT